MPRSTVRDVNINLRKTHRQPDIERSIHDSVEHIAADLAHARYMEKNPGSKKRVAVRVSVEVLTTR
jgi:hypothetical protein